MLFVITKNYFLPKRNNINPVQLPQLSIDINFPSSLLTQRVTYSNYLAT